MSDAFTEHTISRYQTTIVCRCGAAFVGDAPTHSLAGAMARKLYVKHLRKVGSDVIRVTR